jgi:hypothetical protein
LHSTNSLSFNGLATILEQALDQAAGSLAQKMAEERVAEADVDAIEIRKLRMGDGETENGTMREEEGNMSSANDEKPAGAQEIEEEEEKKPSKLKEIWGKIGLDVGTVMMMFKGSVAPFVAIAFYQSDSVSLPENGLVLIVQFSDRV